LALVFLPFAALHAKASALVQLATVSQGSVSPDVITYGTVSADPDHIVALSLPRDVVVASISVRVGQTVRAGDAVATVVTAPTVTAAYRQAMDAVAFAERDLAQNQRLFDLRLATNSQVAAAEKALADAQAQLDAQLRVGADKTTQTVVATAPGIVTDVKASPGQPIPANSVIASVAARDRLIVSVGLEPEDAPHVAAGTAIAFHSPQNQSISFTGKVVSVDRLTDPKTRLVNAVVSVPPAAANNLVVGMVLQGTLELPPRNGLVVPHSALMNDSSGPFVFVVTKGAAHRRPVRIAMTTDKQALISQGLNPGEAVVISGNAELSDGTAVRVQ
jgi:RND family efflux transporter MFP subunit